MVKIMIGPFVDPDGVVMHPLDWQDIQLLKTADGIYIYGSPNQALATPRIWGLPVVVTTAITQNTALVGAFRIGAQVWRRQGSRSTRPTPTKTTSRRT
jgi:HK97 family phage major capsid protein